MPEVDSYRQQRTCGNCRNQTRIRWDTDANRWGEVCNLSTGFIYMDHICDEHEWKGQKREEMKIQVNWTKEKPKIDGYYFVCGPNEDDEVLIRNIEPGSNDHFDTWFSHIEMPEHPLIGAKP